MRQPYDDGPGHSAIERARRELLANLNHEIRTPLTSILGYADLLAASGDLRHVRLSRADAVARIKENGARLLTFLDKLLELAVLESAPSRITRARFSPSSLVERVYAAAEAQARRHGSRLTSEVVGRLPREVEGESGPLARTLRHLLCNAIRFGGRSDVVFRARWQPSPPRECLVFEVEDSGPGISPAQLEVLFEPLLGGEFSGRSYGGTGLGLGLCAGLARRMGAALEVETEFGRGTRFLLTVPVNASAWRHSANGSEEHPEGVI